jgi:hypothetical protein
MHSELHLSAAPSRDVGIAALAPHVARCVRLPHAHVWSTIAWHGSVSGHFAGAWHAAVHACRQTRLGLPHVWVHVPHPTPAASPAGCGWHDLSHR